jgi:hypothetical protein
MGVKVMKELNPMLAVIAVVVSTFTGSATAVLFDFDELPWAGGPAVIENYMEEVYGSDITVTHGIVGNGILNGPLGPDHYIQAGPSWGTHWLSFGFNEVPITAVSFDWATEIDAFHAFADHTLFFSRQCGAWSSGNSGTIYFQSPVTTLKFTDSCLGEIEVDNLIVTPVPEPATVFLLGLGGLALLYKRRK